MKIFVIGYVDFYGEIFLHKVENITIEGALRNFVLSKYDTPEYPCPKNLKKEISRYDIDQLKQFIFDTDCNIDIIEV